MIGLLRGTVLWTTPDTVLIDVGGVGYEVYVTLGTYSEIESSGGEGSEVTLHVFTHLRDDGISLFGFKGQREKRLFEKLLGVGGIGPRLARVILSGMAPDDLLDALATGDVPRLSSIPGVGKKTAQRMALELKDKVAELAAEGPGGVPSPASSPGDDELISALTNLGYKRGHAERALAEQRRESPEAGFEELLRKALRRLSRA